MTHVLFVCSLNRVRSLTAEHLFKDYPGIETRSAGTQENARVVIGRDLLQWADRIFVMERHHKEKILAKFPELPLQKIVVLDIPSRESYMDPELIQMLRVALKPYFSSPWFSLRWLEHIHENCE